MGEVFVGLGGTDFLQSAAIALFWWGKKSIYKEKMSICGVYFGGGMIYNIDCGGVLGGLKG
ncbi:MAG TPA: hypothetical protein DDW30_07540 [Clostridiales bacterium]|nr:hypothetical protein [Clostridiales bacterium]